MASWRQKLGGDAALLDQGTAARNQMLHTAVLCCSSVVRCTALHPISGADADLLTRNGIAWTSEPPAQLQRNATSRLWCPIRCCRKGERWNADPCLGPGAKLILSIGLSGNLGGHGRSSQRTLDEPSQQCLAAPVGCEYGYTGENRERSTESPVRRLTGFAESVLTPITQKDNAGVPSAPRAELHFPDGAPTPLGRTRTRPQVP